MPAKRIIFAILIILFLAGGAVAGVILVKRNQDIREKASTSGGTAVVSLSPTSGSYSTSSTIPVTISFNTNGQYISAIAVRVLVPYDSSNPSSIVANNLAISSDLLASGDWSCPVHTINQSGGNYQVDLSCANLALNGYDSGGSNAILATFDVVVNGTPSQAYNPISLTFDSNLSVITLKSTAEDVLLTPSSTGSYTISGGAAETNTPTLTGTVAAPTETISVNTSTSNVTATATPTNTPVPTSSSSSSTSTNPTSTSTVSQTTLPDSGVSLPFIIGIGLSTLFIVSSVILLL